MTYVYKYAAKMSVTEMRMLRCINSKIRKYMKLLELTVDGTN